jgi:phosphoesterase RecJ-like protein
LATDTGSFRYSSTTPETHKIAAELIESGVDVSDVCERIFESYSYEKVKLTGEAINTLELFLNGKIAIMTIPTELIKKTGAKDEDCDGIINTARGIRGVNVAAMLRQWDNGDIKVNLRSSSQVDVSAIAKQFSGGGHKKAAGYTTGGTLDDARNRLLNEIRKAL